MPPQGGCLPAPVYLHPSPTPPPPAVPPRTGLSPPGRQVCEADLGGQPFPHYPVDSDGQLHLLHLQWRLLRCCRERVKLQLLETLHLEVTYWKLDLLLKEAGAA